MFESLVVQGLRVADIGYRRTFQGAWELSAMVGGYRVSRQYMGYSKREATAMFRAEMAS